MTYLQTDPALRDALAAAGIRTAGDLLHLAQPDEAHNVGTRIALDVAGTNGSFYLKAYRYPGWGKSKGLIGRGSLWGPAPCVREFDNLGTLRTLDVPAPRPVAAASVKRFGRLTAHALMTEWIDEAPSLAQRLADEGDVLRTEADALTAVLRRLGRVVARMHRAGFVHGDLFSRNVLVGRTDLAVWLLDCRRGGLRNRRTSPASDLAGLRADLERTAAAARLDALDSGYLL